jgi:hypothetical protein
MLSSALRRLRTPDELLARVERRAVHDGTRTRADVRTLVAYLNHGRWIADCPNCMNGIVLHPEWPRIGCLGDGCYRTFVSIEMPANWREIEEAVQDRRVDKRNWFPGESLERLRAENMLNRVRDFTRDEGQ